MGVNRLVFVHHQVCIARHVLRIKTSTGMGGVTSVNVCSLHESLDLTEQTMSRTLNLPLGIIKCIEESQVIRYSEDLD